MKNLIAGLAASLTVGLGGSAFAVEEGVSVKLGVGYLPKTRIQGFSGRHEVVYKENVAPSVAAEIPFTGYVAEFGITYLPKRKGHSDRGLPDIENQFVPGVTVSIPSRANMKFGLAYMPETTIEKMPHVPDSRETTYRAVFVPSSAISLRVLGYDTDLGVAYIPTRRGSIDQGSKIKAQIVPTASVSLPF